MSEVTINIPRTTRAAKVGLLSDYNSEEFSGASSYMQQFVKEQKSRRRNAALMAQRKKELAQKTVFTEKFVISNSNQPVEISLQKVAEPSLTLEEAKEEIQNAYDSGFSDGNEAATIAFQNDIEKYKSWVKDFENLSKELRSNFSGFLVKMQDSILPSAILIAKHILVREILHDSEIVVEQARKAIKSIDEDTVLRIAVNPDDVEILSSAKSVLIHDKATAEKIEISGDEHITKGGCIITTSSGIIDATIDAQLNKVYESLIGNV